ncbi:hypothetical protein [Chondromyces apiculatus]|uniref:Uncharacterized protein n=1 Tax=Chondromyces apiculatus DSM 436 TaxID=1192034 RepID=A0A017TJW1_9BACT|nr:hypothetical protein [Chondromyces apiculatus]EYF08941.1 Hypothetical protein CAP_0025 [Chondromyces apiculatus DSM 436]
MRRDQLLSFSAAAVIALVIGHGIAVAQAQNIAPPPPPELAEGAARQAALPPGAQLAESETFLIRMESSRLTVRRQLETARNERDVVKTLCLNDKLNQVDVALRSARERRQGLELAVNRSDADLATHEFTILTVLRQRTEQLSAEANQCIGKEAGYIGDSAVSSSVDPNLPQEDPTEKPATEIIVEPPSCSSCFK